jgi:hypothetical protein
MSEGPPVNRKRRFKKRVQPAMEDVRSEIRKHVDDVEIEMRKHVLQGAFFSKTVHISAWKSPVFKLLAFISSTFTDTQLERDFIMDELLFYLREKARQFGIQVIFADMRW